MTTCPYCGERREDIPKHLAENRETCGAAHANTLTDDLARVALDYAENIKRWGTP